MMGININDKWQPFTDQILAGVKSVETRRTNSLRPYIGCRVGIVRTGMGAAHLVGWATIGEPVIYSTARQFAADRRRHRVAAGSRFDGGRYGYPLTDVVALAEPQPVTSRGIVARRID